MEKIMCYCRSTAAGREGADEIERQIAVLQDFMDLSGVSRENYTMYIDLGKRIVNHAGPSAMKNMLEDFDTDGCDAILMADLTVIDDDIRLAIHFIDTQLAPRSIILIFAPESADCFYRVYPDSIEMDVKEW